MAYQGHIVIPTSHENADSIIDKLTSAMAVRFGGYSRYDGTGGWDSGSDVVEEDHTRLVVNCDDSDRFDRAQFRQWLYVEALYAKHKLEQDAVLIEVHEIGMRMV